MVIKEKLTEKVASFQHMKFHAQNVSALSSNLYPDRTVTLKGIILSHEISCSKKKSPSRLKCELYDTKYQLLNITLYFIFWLKCDAFWITLCTFVS